MKTNVPFGRILERVLPLGGLGLLLCLCGCAGIPPYPSQLPALVATEPDQKEAPDLSGRYRDQGRAFSKDGTPRGDASLKQLLFRQQGAANLDASLTNDVVVVVGPHRDQVELQWWRGEQQIATLTRPKGTAKTAYLESYLWEKGYVKLPLEEAAGVSLLVSGGKEESFRLRKALDGSLIVLHRNTGFWLVALVVPVWRQQTEWYHFPPLQQNGNLK